MPRPSSNPLAQQKERIAAEQARVARELAAMQKMARRKPRPARADLEPASRLKVTTARQRVLPPRPQEHLFPGGRMRPTRRQFLRPKTKMRHEQLKFLLLCLLFVALLVFVWKNFP